MPKIRLLSLLSFIAKSKSNIALRMKNVSSIGKIIKELWLNILFASKNASTPSRQQSAILVIFYTKADSKAPLNSNADIKNAT